MAHLIIKVFLIILLTVFILTNFGFLAAGNYFYNLVMTYNLSNKYSQDFNKEAVAMDFKQTRFKSLPKEYITLYSQHGYQLKGIFIKNAIPTQNTVILVHGISKDKTWSYMKYGDVFLDKGFNLFVYDSRNHGETGGEHPSYGYHEKEDLQTCVSYVKAKCPEGIIGVHGESLGATTALMHAELYNKNKEVSFYIEDCGYSDLRELFTARTVDYNIPKPLRPILVDYLSLVCKVRSGFFLGEVSPIQHMDQITVPVLFIHGNCDGFTPPIMAENLYNKKTGTKALHYTTGAKHARSINVDKAKYNEEVTSFLTSIGMNNM